MKLKFFVDQCVPNSVIQSLQDGGYEVLRLKDFLPTNSPDPKVIAKAQELDTIFGVFKWGFCRYYQVSSFYL